VLSKGLSLIGAVAATAALMLASGYLGPFGMALAILTPMPAAFVHMRFGALNGLSVILLSSLTFWGAGGLQGVLLYLLQFGLPSFLLPLLLRRKMAWDRAVALALVAILALSLLFMVGYAVHSGKSFTALVDTYVQSELNKVMDVYRQVELTAEQLQELRDLATRTAEFMTMAYPGLLTVATGSLLLLMVLVLARFAKGRYALEGPLFVQWKAPELLIWPVILGGFGVFFASGIYYRIAVNLLTITLPIYFLQGIAVVAHFFQRRGVPVALRVLGYLMLVVVNPLPVLVAGIGVFDLWVDFRTPKIKKS